MANNEIKTRLTLDGVKEATDGIKKLGDEGSRTANKLEQSFGRIRLEKNIATSVQTLRGAFRQLGNAGSEIAKGFNQLGSAAATTRNRILYFTAAIAASAYGFKAFVQGGLDAVGQLADLSESLGVSVEDLQAFNFAAAQVGVDSGDFTKGIVSIRQALDELRGSGKSLDGIKRGLEEVRVAGGSTVSVFRGFATSAGGSSKEVSKLSERAIVLRDVFRKMGVSVNKNLSEFDTLKLIADYFKNVAKESDKLGLAIDLFGPKLGPKLLRYLNLGSDGIEQFKQELRDLGILLSSDEVNLGDTAGDQIAKLGEVFAGFRNKVAVELAPGLIAASEAITNVIKDNAGEINKFLREAGTEFSSFIQDIILLAKGGDENQVQNKWLLDLRDGLIKAKLNVESLVIALTNGFQVLSDVLGPIATSINSIFGTEFTGQGLLVIGIVGQLSGAFGLLAGAFMAASALFQGFLTLLRPLAVGLGYVGAAVASLLGLPAIVGVAIVAALAGIAVATYVYWDQIVAYASAAWQSITQFAREGWQGVAEATVSGWGSAVAYLSDTWESIRQTAFAAWEAIEQYAVDAWNGVVQAISGVGNGILTAWSSVSNGIKNLWGSAVDYIISSARSVLSWINGVISSIRSAINSALRLVGLSGQTAQGRAFGGYISGPGTGTSDSIPAWLSNGEYVIRAAAVRKYGTSLFSALNQMRLPSGAIPRFNMGGIVDGLSASLMPRFAAGGLVAVAAPAGGGRPINVTIGNEMFAMSAPEDVAEKLIKYASKRRVASAGRKPSWYGA